MGLNVVFLAIIRINEGMRDRSFYTFNDTFCLHRKLSFVSVGDVIYPLDCQ